MLLLHLVSILLLSLLKIPWKVLIDLRCLLSKDVVSHWLGPSLLVIIGWVVVSSKWRAHLVGILISSLSLWDLLLFVCEWSSNVALLLVRSLLLWDIERVCLVVIWTLDMSSFWDMLDWLLLQILPVDTGVVLVGVVNMLSFDVVVVTLWLSLGISNISHSLCWVLSSLCALGLLSRSLLFHLFLEISHVLLLLNVFFLVVKVLVVAFLLLTVWPPEMLLLMLLIGRSSDVSLESGSSRIGLELFYSVSLTDLVLKTVEILLFLSLFLLSHLMVSLAISSEDIVTTTFLLLSDATSLVLSWLLLLVLVRKGTFSSPGLYLVKMPSSGILLLLENSVLLYLELFILSNSLLSLSGLPALFIIDISQHLLFVSLLFVHLSKLVVSILLSSLLDLLVDDSSVIVPVVWLSKHIVLRLSLSIGIWVGSLLWSIVYSKDVTGLSIEIGRAHV